MCQCPKFIKIGSDIYEHVHIQELFWHTTHFDLLFNCNFLVLNFSVSILESSQKKEVSTGYVIFIFIFENIYMGHIENLSSSVQIMKILTGYDFFNQKVS